MKYLHQTLISNWWDCKHWQANFACWSRKASSKIVRILNAALCKLENRSQLIVSISCFCSCQCVTLLPNLGGVLQTLSSKQALPQTCKGDCTATPVDDIHVSEELNGLASMNHQRKNNYSQLVARILPMQPFAQSASIQDFPDFKRQFTRHDAFYEAFHGDQRDYGAE